MRADGARTPDKETLRKWWVDEDLNRKQIVERHFEETGQRVTPQAISMAVARYGLPAKKNRWDTLLPWRIRNEHVSMKEPKLLRLAGRRMAGLKNSPNLEKWLDGWLAELNEAGRPVVAYYPDDEVEPFRYHPRVPEDGDGEWDLIRRPEVQELLDQRKAG